MTPVNPTTMTTVCEPTTVNIEDVCKTGRIPSPSRLIPHIPIKIQIPRHEPDRVLTHPPRDKRIIPPIEMPVQERIDVERAAGEAHQVRQRARVAGIDGRAGGGVGTVPTGRVESGRCSRAGARRTITTRVGHPTRHSIDHRPE